MFADAFEKPRFRPNLNIGGGFDIPTGHWVIGKNGESICTGGLGPLTGVVSRPNNFKTALSVFFKAMARRAFHNIDQITYDSEGTLDPYVRFQTASMGYEYIDTIDYMDDPQFIFTDLSRYTGDMFFMKFREQVNDKIKNALKYELTTPFVDRDGNCRSAIMPTTVLIDSFSKFQISEVQDMYAKNKIGDSKNNTDAMTSGKAKNQLFNQIPIICAQSSSYFILTAHIADVINLEMYPTDKRNLASMKKDTKLAGVSGGFYSLPNNVWSIDSNKPLLTRDKMPQYPWDNSTAIEGDTDLRALEVMNLRGKGGITGMYMTVLVSQTEGFQPALTDFHNCYEASFGILGNNINYQLALRPDVKLGRTTVRKKLAEDVKLRRAAEIQHEMLQCIQFHRVDKEGVYCTPQELYTDLIELGYDWDELLNTRPYWVFNEEADQHLLPFLSTMDLLRMRKGLYIPYYYSDERKAAIREAFAKKALAAAK